MNIKHAPRHVELNPAVTAPGIGKPYNGFFCCILTVQKLDFLYIYIHTDTLLSFYSLKEYLCFTVRCMFPPVLAIEAT
jgi:hypothetical protein